MGKNTKSSAKQQLYRDSDSNDRLLSKTELAQTQDDICTCNEKSSARILIPWLLNVVLLVAFGGLLARDTGDCAQLGFWRPHELKPATRELPKLYHEVQFDAALHYNESHLLYRPVTDPPYVGDPSPEIDAAWKDLMGSVDVFITPEEQKELDQDLWLDPQTGLYVGLLSVMHDLHCVNMVRMSLYPDYYPKMKHYTTKMHIEHCLDVLRLSLMCTGDLTLIPTKDSDSRPFEAVFETTHSCRDFPAIRQWSLDRDSATPEHYLQNAEKLKLKAGIV